MDEPLHAELKDSVLWLTLNRPTAGNTIDVELARTLVEWAGRAGSNQEVRVVVITGAGKLFCGGGDIHAFQSGESPSAAINAITSRLHPAIEALAGLEKPVVTLINGPAAGAGLGLALLGDIVVAGRSAHFTSAYTAIGLTPDGGSSWILPRLIGLRRAQEMVLTNRRISADEAQAIGLVTRVVDDEQLHDEGANLARTLARSATSALGTSRRLLDASFGHSLHDHLALEARYIAEHAEGREGREGIASFIEKRRPKFT